MIAMADSELRFRDFSSSPEPIVLRIAPHDFHLYPEIPLDAMVELAALSQGETTDIKTRMGQMLELLGSAMDPRDFDTFVKRTKRPTSDEPNEHPIGMRHLLEIVPWMMEVYGLRPTQASSESASGSDDADTSSTALASDEASTS